MRQNGSVERAVTLDQVPDHAAFSYQEAFARHLGLVNPEEQDRLRSSRVAIAGMGGVGGIHLITLARLGIGSFHIADPDDFELANFNRQYGATVRSLGRGKAEVMAEEARAINPELQICASSPRPITPANVGEFLDGVDVLVDGIDFFAIDARRLVFREARRRGIWAITAGPIGFSAAWLVFSPTGMSFDDYFDLDDGMDRARPARRVPGRAHPPGDPARLHGPDPGGSASRAGGRRRGWPAIFAAGWRRPRSSRSSWAGPRSGRPRGISSSTPIGRGSARDGSRGEPPPLAAPETQDLAKPL